MSADGGLPITTDMDGATRNGTWDIGADEVPVKIYYSVGTSVADLNTGSRTVAVTGGNTATFSADLPTNIGVGDQLTYSGNIAYIVSRTSAGVYVIQSATGGAAVNVGEGTACTINRTFNSLSLAEANSVGASYLNTTSLLTANAILYWPCYADGADTTALVIDGYTTGWNNFIKIYTPVSTTEVGVTQRHSGVFDSNKFNMNVGAQYVIHLSDANVEICGIQGTLNANNQNNRDFIFVNTTDAGFFNLSKSIIKGNISGTSQYPEGLGLNSADIISIVYNNIFYSIKSDDNTATAIWKFESAGPSTIYNNTIYDGRGIITIGGVCIVKNNITQT
ncbi:MAG: hypothetical protein ACD_79C01424G0001, partial [uncultured bacterium]